MVQNKCRWTVAPYGTSGLKMSGHRLPLLEGRSASYITKQPDKQYVRCRPEHEDRKRTILDGHDFRWPGLTLGRIRLFLRPKQRLSRF